MYEKFFKINGYHPWREVSEDGYIDYPVRYRKGGRVLFFNFALAREMELIARKHPSHMNHQLEEIILKTFALRILNEHDWINKKTFPKDGLEDRLYMATRYLQAQHKNKQGKTSGDGRGIWNGVVKTKTMTFDVTSRGTGATILCPGAQAADGLLKTGDQQYGYASGLADLEEMLASAIMSEIFYQRGLPTERCLAVIDYKDKTAIGIRTALNLIRPAHLFRYLKMEDHDGLEKSFDYFLRRQETNGSLVLQRRGHKRYRQALVYLAKVYAKLAAVMEDEYIFNWLSWDGDNMLASGAILDYGSIRQFAAKHDKYRYEDVDRFSTSLNEQRYWARKIIQVFAQAVDFIVTGKKKNLKVFDDDPTLKLFDQYFLSTRQERTLARIGFTPQQINKLTARAPSKVNAFITTLNYFEDVKTKQGKKVVADGIDHPPVFLVRHILRELPKFILKHKIMDDKNWPYLSPEQFCKTMAASYVNHHDLQLTKIRGEKAEAFQRFYRDLICAVSPKPWGTLKVVAQRSSVINYPYRSTGDGLLWIVKEAIDLKDKGDIQHFQEAIDRFIESQVLVPEKWKPIKPSELKGDSTKARLLNMIQRNLELFNENI
ncbi:MAG TPA: hypothetical protein DD723_00455 [Candidatus Omnitrophica bacterium]|nr:MAG: hypothetical protein A2Z81_09650 [Omnitrophica WOR_2 bacterium GWA2_45_18]OGX19044.1 MAG: hypothetical protein A2Y04_02215 [Omnitrophica WOR_2 bacterium GWC2_45_7]HBR14002.1 hypothetical protein [Candidatus Omnitrophota bacterium]